MSKGAEPRHVSVLGAGSWGTALAMLIARNGFPVRLWDLDAGHVEHMRNHRENARYLPGIPLPGNLDVYHDMSAAVDGAAGLLVVVPSHAFRATLHAAASLPATPPLLAWGTKGSSASP